jgi:eukaryotic-like serine/threonine-protein kinase
MTPRQPKRRTNNGDQAGELLGDRYRLDERIAGGGMGEVWRATDTLLQRVVAVKLLRESLSEDPIVSERFRREALLAAQISHPNMAGVFDYVQEHDRPGIVMEFVDGETLADRLSREGRLPVGESVRIGSGLLAALQSAHDAGIVHRDVKPGNVMLTTTGDVKVTDFGIARAASDHTLTETGTVIGTAHYLAPEQVSGAQATPLSDLYSVGAILYEMLGGRKPFEAETPIAVAMKRISEDPAPLRTLRKDVPEPVAAIVARALVRDPAERFASAADMRRALEEAYADVQPATLPQKIDPTPTMVLPIEEAGAAEATTAAVRPAVSEETGVGPPAAVARRRRREYKRLIAYAIVLALVVAGGTLALLALTGNGPAVVTTPNFKGGTVEQARTKAAGLGLKLRELPRDSSLPAGTVTGQSIAAGTPIGKGAEITIGVSTGNPPPPAEGSVPNVVGMTKEEAEQALKDAGFEVKQTEAQATGVDAGTVIGQYPAPGDMAQEGTQVTIVVATQPPKRHGKGRNSD